MAVASFAQVSLMDVSGPICGVSGVWACMDVPFWGGAGEGSAGGEGGGMRRGLTILGLPRFAAPIDMAMVGGG